MAAACGAQRGCQLRVRTPHEQTSHEEREERGTRTWGWDVLDEGGVGRRVAPVVRRLPRSASVEAAPAPVEVLDVVVSVRVHRHGAPAHHQQRHRQQRYHRLFAHTRAQHNVVSEGTHTLAGVEARMPPFKLTAQLSPPALPLD
jgi:hypothetical protein